ncbi:MAG: hypothetical protein CM1200mP2_03510 [Planctomycetaceae bacterium]|nr:MAG: hypothetical protein CM1200mP2_03510 [Planctomycetaceae bacterium]
MVKKFSAGGDHFANFVSAVRSRKHTDLNADIENGHLSSALCHLGNVSYRLGQAISGARPAKRFDGTTRRPRRSVGWSATWPATRSTWPRSS